MTLNSDLPCESTLSLMLSKLYEEALSLLDSFPSTDSSIILSLIWIIYLSDYAFFGCALCESFARDAEHEAILQDG